MPGLLELGDATVISPQCLSDVLLPGRWPAEIDGKGAGPESSEAAVFNVRCLITRRVRTPSMFKARVLDQCDSTALKRWEAHNWDQAPYQYQCANCVVRLSDGGGGIRRLLACEEEVLHDVAGRTAGLVQRDAEFRALERRRHVLLGNSWHADVIAFLWRAALADCHVPPAAVADIVPYLVCQPPPLAPRPIASEYMYIVTRSSELWRELFDACPYNGDHARSGLCRTDCSLHLHAHSGHAGQPDGIRGWASSFGAGRPYS